MTDTATYPNDPSCVRSARFFTQTVLRRLGVPAERRAVAELLVSELATNAIKHAGTSFSLAITVEGPTVLIEVTDTGNGKPTPHRPGPHQTNGRGLLIVENMADEWGTNHEGISKTVWCTLSKQA